MVNRRRKARTTQTPLQDFVTVAFAEDLDLAKHYKKILNDNEIPAAIKKQPDGASGFPGIAVMVPEEHLDEAHIIIESEASQESFYDMAFQDDEDVNFDENLYDDDDDEDLGIFNDDF